MMKRLMVVLTVLFLSSAIWGQTADSKFTAARALFAAHDWTGAITGFEGVLADTSASNELKARAQYKIGQAYRETGKYYEAEPALQSVISTYPTSPWAERAKLLLAGCYYIEKKYPQAITELNALISASSDAGLIREAQVVLANTYQKNGDHSQAIQTFGNIASDAGSGNYLLQRVYLRQVDSYVALGQNKNAMQALCQSLSHGAVKNALGAKRDDILRRILDICWDKGDAQEALLWSTRALNVVSPAGYSEMTNEVFRAIKGIDLDVHRANKYLNWLQYGANGKDGIAATADDLVEPTTLSGSAAMLADYNAFLIGVLSTVPTKGPKNFKTRGILHGLLGDTVLEIEDFKSLYRAADTTDLDKAAELVGTALRAAKGIDDANHFLDWQRYGAAGPDGVTGNADDITPYVFR